MKHLITLIVFTTASFLSFSQPYSVEITQSTARYIRQLPKKEQQQFDSVLALRKSADWLRRIDSIPFDYAFIREEFSYCDSSGSVEERYFAQDDTIPKFLFDDGKSIDRDAYFKIFLEWYTPASYYGLTLNAMLGDYSAFRQIQERPYDKQQVLYTGCIVRPNAAEDFRKSRAAYLGTSYRIMTLIDKVNNKIIVSVQTAPANPEFEVQRVGGVSF